LGRIEKSLIDVLLIPAAKGALRESCANLQWHAKRFLMGAYLRYAQDSPQRLKRLADRQSTPKQQAAKLREEIAQINTTAQTLGNCGTLFSEDPDHLHAILELLKAKRIERQQRLNALAVDDQQGGQWDRSRNSNASQVYTEFWNFLTEKWLEIVPAATTRRHWRKHLRKFLIACSEPVFPKGTTDKTLTAFIDGYFRKRPPKVTVV
jgi:hypothetical protein